MNDGYEYGVAYQGISHNDVVVHVDNKLRAEAEEWIDGVPDNDGFFFVIRRPIGTWEKA